MLTYEWKCPKCQAPANTCGKDGKRQQFHHRGEECLGFICECAGDTAPEHGTVLSDPCEEANCYHCGWGGTFPSPPKGLQAWEKKALAAGWSSTG